MKPTPAFFALIALALPLAEGAPQVDRPRPLPPQIVVETSKGTFVVQTYPLEAPRTVAHILNLARRGFYDGLLVHRVVPGFVVQFGDPQTRDPAKRELWGRGDGASSGTPIGASEATKKLTHRTGAVGVAHMGNPARADSQIYITLAPRPDLDGQYTVFAQVVEGSDVPSQLQTGDEIRRAAVREQTSPGRPASESVR
jgi:cyclophilin family peptidyl-prolyl cis-trans isomerase